jgi:16S rRNA (cytosine967-C5)-methyltransferase
VYSTCSLEPEENEHVLKMALAEFRSLNLAKEAVLLPFRDGVDGAYAAKLIREPF